jgi:hypothetical protein
MFDFPLKPFLGGKKVSTRLSYLSISVFCNTLSKIFLWPNAPHQKFKVRMVFFCGTEILNRMKNFQKYVFYSGANLLIYFKSKYTETIFIELRLKG